MFVLSLVKTLLEYVAAVLSLYTLSNMRRLDKVRNHFPNCASYPLNIPHPPHDYSLISNIFNLKSLTKHRNISCCNFINRLIEGAIDAPRLLERFDIRILEYTRFQDLFYLPVNSFNFANNSPLVRMMSIVNNLSV
jgi:hypothetical protein